MDDQQLIAFEESTKKILSRLAKKANQIGEATVGLFQSHFGTNAPGWPDLASSTQAQRVAQGYPANEPLLRSGIIRDSFVHEEDVADDGMSVEVIVGIKSGTIRIFPYDRRPRDVGLLMVWHERGTATEPPRPLLPIVGDQLEGLLRKYLREANTVVVIEAGQNKV